MTRRHHPQNQATWKSIKLDVLDVLDVLEAKGAFDTFHVRRSRGKHQSPIRSGTLPNCEVVGLQSLIGQWQPGNARNQVT